MTKFLAILFTMGTSAVALAQVNVDDIVKLTDHQVGRKSYSFEVAPEMLPELETESCQDYMDFISGTTPIEDFDGFAMHARTLSAAVVKNGKLVYRQGFNGVGEAQARLYSISKSATSLALARLMTLLIQADEYNFDLNKLLNLRLVKLVPSFAQPAAVSEDRLLECDEEMSAADDEQMYACAEKRRKWRREVTLLNAWEYSVGQQWCEYASCAAYDYVQIAGTKHMNDTLKYVLSKPMVSPPGMQFTYSAGNYALLSAAIRTLIKKYPLQIDGKALKYETMYEQLLFSPLGMLPTDSSFQRDKKGLFIAGAGLSMNISGLMKLGQLVMNGGVWNDNVLILDSIMKKMLSTNKALMAENTPQVTRNWEGKVFHGFWGQAIPQDPARVDDATAEKDPALHIDRHLQAKMRDEHYPILFPFMPEISDEMVYGGGNFGQFLMMFPKSKTMFLRLGADPKHAALWNPTAKKMISCFAREENEKHQLIREFPYERPDEFKAKVPDLAANGYKGHDKDRFIARGLLDNVLPNTVAKELCGCYYARGLQCSADSPDPFKKCQAVFPYLELDEIQSAKMIANFTEELIPSEKAVKVTISIKGLGPFGTYRWAKARFKPEKGICEIEDTEIATPFLIPEWLVATGIAAMGEGEPSAVARQEPSAYVCD